MDLGKRPKQRTAAQPQTAAADVLQNETVHSQVNQTAAADIPQNETVHSQVNHHVPTEQLAPPTILVSMHNPLHRTDYTISSYSTLTHALTPGARLIDIPVPSSNSSTSYQHTTTSNEVRISTYSSLAGALGDF